MIFKGFQKTTLLDFPGRVACTVFTGGCNFRCPFCHNASLVEDANAMTDFADTEVLSHLKKRRGILDGVCITGGEPLLHKELIPFLQEVKDLGFAVKLDTNGTFPDRLAEILKAGLVDYVAMDIKNTAKKYALTAGVDEARGAKMMQDIQTSISLLMNEAPDYEFRTTVVKEFHTAQDIEEIAQMLSGAKHYFLQGFIDSGHLIDENCHGYAADEMKELLAIAQKHLPVTRLRGVDDGEDA